MDDVAPTELLLGALIDDAGLFPPEALAMRPALERHRLDLAEGRPELSGRFVCPLDRLGELQAALGESERIALALIVSPLEARSLEQARQLVAADGRLELSCIEGVPGAIGEPSGSEGPPVFAEISLTDGWREELGRLATAGLGVKVRCGGLAAELFPSPRRLAALIVALAAEGVRFKATAGLHHAVRHLDETTGFVHHGFLNLLLATCRATVGAGEEEVTAVLECEDGRGLAAEAAGIDIATAERARSLFCSYGSCSTSEPLEDLALLGLRREQAEA